MLKETEQGKVLLTKSFYTEEFPAVCYSLRPQGHIFELVCLTFNSFPERFHCAGSTATPESTTSWLLIALNMGYYCSKADRHFERVISYFFVLFLILKLGLPPVMWFGPHHIFEYLFYPCSVDSKQLKTFIIPMSKTDLEHWEISFY